MNIDAIQNGYVIDHISAGRSMEIYEYLGLDKQDCPIAILKNVPSSKKGKKDIIKIAELIPIDFDVLGFVDPNITVNVIINNEIAEKKKLRLPKQVTNIIKCKNPRCITSVEQELPQIFKLTDERTRSYRCIYCETGVTAR